MPPPGFAISAAEAIGPPPLLTPVREELAEIARTRVRGAFIRGDRWQVNYIDGGSVVAFAVVDGTNGQVDEAWRDFQVATPLARGYEGAIAQKVNAPYVWLPLCLLFLAPFFDPRRPLRLVHLDLLVLLGARASRSFASTAPRSRPRFCSPTRCSATS